MGNNSSLGIGNSHSNVGDEESGWLFQVLEFCDIEARSNAIFVCKRYHKLLTTNASFRWRLERLHIEDGVYCAAAMMSNKAELQHSLVPVELLTDFETSSESTSFKTLYLRLLEQRMLWYNKTDHMMDDSASVGNEVREIDDSTPSDDIEAKGDDSFNIHVSVRFKPTITNNNQGRDSCQHAVTLPLHQRLALIKHQHRLKSNSEALNILKEEGEWFKDKWSAFEKENMVNTSIDGVDSIDGVEGKTQKDQSHLELSSGINSIDSINHNVVIVDPTKGLRNFQFDRVLPESCEQGTVYENSAKPLVQDFINGTNACCLVYGVTGSGKTFTMFGPENMMQNNTKYIQSSSVKKGIVPMVCGEIFDVLAYRKKNLNLNIEARVSLSYVEIFGSEISDLLRHGSLCCSNKAASQRFVLSGASEYNVCNVEEVSEALKRGEREKRKAATALNDRSSRAHSVVIISLTQVCEQTGVSRSSKLFLADLGGCEQTKKSDIVSGASKHFEKLKMELSGYEYVGDLTNEPASYSTGFIKSDRMREAVNINLGLMALKSCVDALISKAKYIPYSDSKLTMMLSSALGGNSKTSVIVCASQEKHLVKETIAALKFGQSCRRISNSLQSETDFLKQLLDNIDSQIQECQAEIKQKERWEIKEEKRKDVLAEDGTLESKGFGGMETRKTTILVGAEEQHLRLSELLKQRAEITGVSTDYGKEGRKYGGEVGFGNAHIYGMGKKYTAAHNESEYRFGNAINDDVPISIRSVVGNAPCTWKAGKEASLNEIEKNKIEKMKKKSQLVYTGLSV